MDLRKALVVGIDNYPTSPLRGCINDANAVASILKTNGNGSPNFDVRVYTDVKRQSDLRCLIRETFDGESDTRLFYFSGHGASFGTRSFIVTPDYEPSNEGISMEEVLEVANGSGSGNRVVILDCCHSGAFGSPGMFGGDTALIADGVSILTACMKDEASAEVCGHGVFTSLLLAALRGGAADVVGSITPGSVYAYVDRALGPWGQRPVFKTNTSRFISLREVAPQVSRETLRRITGYFGTPEEEYALDPSYEDTNSPTVKHEVVEPYADAEHVAVFKDLQRMQSVGLVVPVEEDYMYFAAMRSKACRLTALGHYYWGLVKNGRL